MNDLLILIESGLYKMLVLIARGLFQALGATILWLFLGFCIFCIHYRRHKLADEEYIRSEANQHNLFVKMYVLVKYYIQSFINNSHEILRLDFTSVLKNKKRDL